MASIRSGIKRANRFLTCRQTEVIGRTDSELFSQKMVTLINKEDDEARLNQVSISNKKIADKIPGRAYHPYDYCPDF